MKRRRALAEHVLHVAVSGCPADVRRASVDTAKRAVIELTIGCYAISLYYS